MTETEMTTAETETLSTPLKQEAAPADASDKIGKLKSLLYGFRTIGAPLLAAVTEVRPFMQEDGSPSSQADATAFRDLVQSNILVAQSVTNAMEAESQTKTEWTRWSVAGAAAKIVSAHYRATGKSMGESEANEAIAALDDLAANLLDDSPIDETPAPVTVGMLRLKMMEAMAPVVGSVSRYSFGRTEQTLVGEVAARLQKTALEAARSMVPEGCTEEEWRLIYGGVLEVAGHLYAESHYAEADRLLDMRPDERTAYLTRYGNKVPMGPVWESFDLNMAMLTAVASYLEVPESAGLVAPSLMGE